MKLFLVISILFLLNHCSFDNKTGIWKDANNPDDISVNNNDVFKEFKKTSTTEEKFNRIIQNKKKIKLLFEPLNNDKWNDIFYSSNNNLKNFKYKNLNLIVFKSKKLTKNYPNKYLLYDNKNLIFGDDNGNLIVFSIYQDKIISKYNFYKNKFKKIKKKLNFIVENNIIYVGDNLGYIYAYNYSLNKIIWAKNYKIPFSSNIKIINNKILISNQNNNLYILSKKNGELLKLIPTEEFVIKNQFINNLSTNKNTLFYLNSFGSLYSINTSDMKVNWFNNFNQSLDLLPSNLFFGNTLVNTNKVIIISSNNKTFLIDTETGLVLKKFNFSSNLKPIVVDNIVFLLTSNNYLIAIDLKTKNIIYSYNITNFNQLKIKNFKDNLYKDIMILNDDIYIFFKNSMVLNLDINGQFKNYYKLPSKINTSPISIEQSILYLNNKNRLIILN